MHGSHQAKAVLNLCDRHEGSTFAGLCYGRDWKYRNIGPIEGSPTIFSAGRILLIHTCGLIGYAAFCQVYVLPQNTSSCTKHFMSSLRMYSLALVAFASTVQKEPIWLKMIRSLFPIKKGRQQIPKSKQNNLPDKYPPCDG